MIRKGCVKVDDKPPVMVLASCCDLMGDEGGGGEYFKNMCTALAI